MGIKRCPKCGNTKLLARKITGVQVESLENGEFQINAEGKKYQIEIIGCAKCKAEFDESQLVEMVQCKKCGKFTEPANLDANGECDVCRALEERPDLANMSKEDLIRMMLKLERTTSNNIDTTKQVNTTSSTNDMNTGNETVSTEINTVAQEKMKAAQAAIENVSNDFSKEIIEDTEKELEEIKESVNEIQNAMNPPETVNSIENSDEAETINSTETETEIEKPKRGRRPRKKTDVDNQEENNSNSDENLTEEQIQESANEISENQEAPFPEQDVQMQEMFNENIPQENIEESVQQTQNSPFQMFDNEQSF